MDTDATPADHRYLRRAVELGRKGWGRVHPNPMVGCVLVRDEQVVGEGWHEEFGGPHAEIRALTAAGARAEGASAYVSLEPCNHYGHTPPCSLALLAAGVSRVVFGGREPGPEASGGGDALRVAGVEVVGPVFPIEDARRENPAFYFNHEKKAAYVALKLAQTLDGCIAEAPGHRTTITGEKGRFETHRLRAGFAGVMVGSETVLVDDPLLTVRESVDLRVQPTRVILDSRGRIKPDANVFRDIPDAPLLLFTSDRAPQGTVHRWEEAGATVRRVPDAEGGLSLEAVLDACWNMDIRSLFCEGGGRLASSLLRAGLAQRLFLFVAPFVLGKRGVPAFTDLESREAWQRWQPAAPSRLFGRDALLVFDRME